MVKVKIIKLDERYVETRTKQEEELLGEIREAFEVCLDYEEEEYKKQYALNMGNGVWFLPVDCCEVVEGLATMENNSKDETHKPKSTSGILLVEDGSVDIDHIEDDLGIPCIVYRQGANKPEWL